METGRAVWRGARGVAGLFLSLAEGKTTSFLSSSMDMCEEDDPEVVLEFVFELVLQLRGV